MSTKVLTTKKYSQNCLNLNKKSQYQCNQEKQRLIEENMGLVYLAAKKFVGKGAEFEDVVQCGGIGLIKAASNFDPSLGIKFSTYAISIIFGEIKTFFRENFSFKFSRKTKDLYLKIRSETEKFINSESRYPTISELSKILNADKDSILDALECGKSPISLTNFVDNENSKSGNDSTDIEIPSENFGEFVENKISLEAIIEALKKFDKNLIKLRFYGNKTQSETAKILKVTQATVSKREKILLSVLRKKLS